MVKRFCINCGKEIPSDVDFCPYCGAKQIVNNDSSSNNSNDNHHNNSVGHTPGLIASTKLYFKDMAVVDKRMSRADFWWSYLGMVILSFAIFFAASPLNALTNNALSNIIIFLMGGAEAILGIASFTASIRRLHDTERSGWLILLGLIPIVGAIILIILYCQPSVKNTERFNAPTTAEWYKKWWVWTIAVLIGLIFVGSYQEAVTSSSSSTASSTSTKNNDSSPKDDADHDDEGDEDDTDSNSTDSSKDSESQESKESESQESKESESQESKSQEPESKAPSTSKVSTEFKNALETAKDYSDSMHLSKAAIYDQLTSTDGEGFPADAAQYAIDNLKADYNKNALETAKTYSKEMHMSTQEIRDQLTSADGEQFTASEADYAIQHLNDK
ncbi:Ltp family lipoprotein [Pediococcus acidilactici]|uniref:Ltp family lipoprotein n=1 Tax=Pediococcus acidilactici TaxID=1254 RepID=UPI003CEE7FD9